MSTSTLIVGLNIHFTWRKDSVQPQGESSSFGKRWCSPLYFFVILIATLWMSAVGFFLFFFFMCTNKILSAIMALSYYFELKNKRESQNCPPFWCLKATFNDYTCQHCSVLGSFERVEGQNFKSKLCCFINVAPLYSCQKKRKKKLSFEKYTIISLPYLLSTKPTRLTCQV